MRFLTIALAAVALSVGAADTDVKKGETLRGQRLTGRINLRGGCLVDCTISNGVVMIERGGAVSNCVFTSCKGTWTVCAVGKESAEVVGCVFTNNTSSMVVGNGYKKDASVTLISCRFEDNVCWGAVAGAFSHGPAPRHFEIRDTTFSRNTSKWGPVVVGAELVRCTLVDNAAENSSAVVTSGSLIDCQVKGNRGTGVANVVAVGSEIRNNRTKTLDAVDTLKAATNCALTVGALVGGDVHGGVNCTRGPAPARKWHLNADGSFPLVRDGTLVAKLVAREEGPAQTLANKEYRRLMKTITGCDADPAAHAAAEGVIELRVDPSLGGGDTYEVRFEGERLVLCGSNGRSTWFALMELMERLGCRWFWPGSDGEYLPKPTKDLSVPQFTVRRTAAFPMRSLSPHPEARKEMFLAHNRFNPFLQKIDWGQTRSEGGHSFVGIYPDDCKNMRECRDKYPEMMAMWTGGKRRPDQHCYTNPKTEKLFVDWICRFWETHPDCEILGLSPVDTPVHCCCPECKKHGDSSTLYFDFLTRIVNAANAKWPDKRYRSYAYSFYWNVPSNAIPKNVMLDYCMYDRCYMHALNDPTCEKNQTPVRKMTEWKKLLGGVAPAVYGYHFDWGGEPFFVPQNRVLQDELKWARDFGVTYWHTEWMCGWQPVKSASDRPPRETEPIYAYRLSAYCLGRLLWDPDADLTRIEADWCKRVYGAAGREMLDYFAAMETAWMKGTGHPSWYGIRPVNYVAGFLTDELIGRCDALFAAAERKLAATDDMRAKGEVALEKAFWLKWRNFAIRQLAAERLAVTPDQRRLTELKTMPAGRTLYPRAGEKNDRTEFAFAAGDKKAFWPQGAWTCPAFDWVNVEVSFEVRFDGPRPAKDGMKDYNTYLGDSLTVYLRQDGVRYGKKFSNVEFALSPDCCGPFKRVAYPKPFDAAVWHKVRVRTADARLFAWVDGELVYEGGASIGGGRIDFKTSRPAISVRNLMMSELLPLPGSDSARSSAGGETKIDGTGRRVGL